MWKLPWLEVKFDFAGFDFFQDVFNVKIDFGFVYRFDFNAFFHPVTRHQLIDQSGRHSIENVPPIVTALPKRENYQRFRAWADFACWRIFTA